MAQDCNVLRNSFATECFTNIADEDYVAARAAYQMGLMNHFLWSSLQAVEKYLKAILLYNGESAKGLAHKVDKAWDRVSRLKKLPIQLNKEQLFLIAQLAKFGSNRYLERSAYTTGQELQSLDSLVWSLRRFCQPLDIEVNIDENRMNWLGPSLRMLMDPYYEKNPSKLALHGSLEKILRKDAGDPARKVLVWQNAFFSKRRPSRIRVRTHSVNAPHFRNRDYYLCLRDLVDFPKDVRDKLEAKQ